MRTRFQVFTRVIVASLIVTFAATAAFAQKAPASQTASQFYMAYRAAFDKATKLEEILPWMASKNRAQAEATPAADRAKMFGMVKIMNALTDVKIVKETRTADGGATLTVTAVDADKKKATGTVDVIKEGGEWKIGQESWKSGDAS
jgi:hypothetical protein